MTAPAPAAGRPERSSCFFLILNALPRPVRRFGALGRAASKQMLAKRRRMKNLSEKKAAGFQIAESPRP
jgi:hypothetical protein